jgi:ribosomal peptide maturation radical SAM protein 1
MNRIALISTPWPLFNRPSIQLGSLKAFVSEKLSATQVTTHHIYLTVAQGLGHDLYSKISERTWLAESLYAALLYPGHMETVAQFWKRKSSGVPFVENCSFDELFHTVNEISTEVLDHETWDRYLLVGFSLCFSQITSSLYFIQEIKQRAPDIKIVVGGAACAGDMGRSLLQSFPDIDFVIQGEGELPLIHLIKLLEGSQGYAYGAKIPGLISRHESVGREEVSQVPRLDELPIPDYSDYFRDLRSYEPKKLFLPKLPMEISRGCWWRKKVGPRESAGCAFCNLNLQWHGYRMKSHDRVIEELDFLTKKYQVLSVSFMDNLLPARNLERLFKRIKGLGKDLRLFSELRATTPHADLVAMGFAGMGEIQVGIESLNSRLLKKLNKGTTAMDNMEIMKNCETPGLPNLTGNLILNFPSSDEQDVAETLANLKFASPFRPLKGIPFWLGYVSPVWQTPHAYGIKRIRNHPFYAYLFPPEVLQGLRLMIQGYQGGVRHQHRIWRPVREKLEEWGKTYRKLHQTPWADPILSYRDGLDFLIIRERRFGNNDMTHRLQGTSRRIYLFCETQRSMPQILSHFPGFGEEKVRPFLHMMVNKRLMFNEGDLYLSLAVPADDK